MAHYNSDSSDSEPGAGPSSAGAFSQNPELLKEEDSSASGSDDTNAFSENFNAMKALYADNVMLPVHNAPMYENLSQFEASFSTPQVLPVGCGKEVQEREEKKKRDKLAFEKALEEKNKARFAKYAAPSAPETKVARNIFTRQEEIHGPLSALNRCMERNLKVKVMTRHATGIRGYLHGFVACFDKHWNLLMVDVLEVYRRKSTKKLKVPPEGGRPVPKGTANFISPIPEVRATSIGNSQWECARGIPQMMVRGEHVVTINIIDQ